MLIELLRTFFNSELFNIVLQSEFLAAVIGAAGSIITAFIQVSKPGPVISILKVFFYVILFANIGWLISFVGAIIGNVIQSQHTRSSLEIFLDSLDPLLIGAGTCAAGCVLGIMIENLPAISLAARFSIGLVLMILSFPVSFAVAWAFNFSASSPGRPLNTITWDSLDSCIMGGIVYVLGYLLGRFLGRSQLIRQ